MKNVFRFLLVLLFFIAIQKDMTFSQVSINSDNSQPDNSAMLDLKSVNRGFLPPRLTLTQVEAISSPAEGLVVYCTSWKCLLLFNGSRWGKLDGSAYFTLFSQYGGGKIFYLDSSGLTGLISALADQSTGAEWGCYGYSMGTNTGIGYGAQNTVAIVSGCATEGIAAKVCDNLSLNSYTDWFLPSKDELNQMYLRKDSIGGFFTSSHYWSSSEFNVNNAWRQYFGNGYQLDDGKDNYYRVRCIRKF